MYIHTDYGLVSFLIFFLIIFLTLKDWCEQSIELFKNECSNIIYICIKCKYSNKENKTGIFLSLSQLMDLTSLTFKYINAILTLFTFWHLKFTSGKIIFLEKDANHCYCFFNICL